MILALRILYFEDLSVGMTETLSKTIAASDVVGFAQLTGDRNPIHLSEHFAAKTQFGKRIAHGLYTASLISAVLGTRLPGPGAVYISQTLNFRAPVKIGDQVDVTVTVAELIPERQRARLACNCKVADEIVLDGEALVKVPAAAAAVSGKGDRAISIVASNRHLRHRRRRSNARKMSPPRASRAGRPMKTLSRTMAMAMLAMTSNTGDTQEIPPSSSRGQISSTPSKARTAKPASRAPKAT